MEKELIKKAKQCKTKQELLKLAKENDFELSPEEAELYLQEFEEGEISDIELDNVAGGQDGCAKPANPYSDEYWASEGQVEFIFNEGDIVQAFALYCKHHTATVKVVSRKAQNVDIISPKWRDVYWLEKEPGCKTAFLKGWYPRSSIEK